ncbi:MAG TPA: tetratricopeptide repeat protein [Actinocrinis sp.]|nr:tetratricopeptide repeat protein [Actinocrinis sp.]
MSGVKCARPGCAGTIEDGYCDTCGMAAAPASAGAGTGALGAVAGAGASSRSVSVSVGAVAGGRARCRRPGCAGTIEDGYCDTCGMAALPGTGRPAGNTASNRTASSRTGSSRTSTSTGRSRGSAVSARTGSTGRTGGSRGSRSTGRGGLGLGLVEIPQVPYRDPAEAVLADPQVPEHKRYCSKCGDPVGRGRDGRPGRTSGFCAKCGGAYDFRPKLQPGDLVGNQYRIEGCIAHGGLGWIYLAVDDNVAGRWVALKGLLDTGDEDAMAAAVAERQFLAEVEHPSVVKIYNFIQHQGDDYIVMEYVGGKSLKQIALDYKDEHRGASLPLEQVLAYAIEVLPAFGYLHSIGLLYCDFKPDNIIQNEEQLKLIDMGAVRAFDDEESAIYGTVGYQAPEVAEIGPTVESDLYTVGRMMAVLAFEFKGYTSAFATSLPAPDAIPLLARYESFYRALLRSTHPSREQRFSTAQEMVVQLTGVLREVVAINQNAPSPAVSTLFSAERAAVGTDLARPSGAQLAAALPIPMVDPTDPNAGFLATLGGSPRQVVTALDGLPHPSTEVYFRLVRATIEGGEFSEAARWLDLLGEQDRFDWRVRWYRGLLVLAQNDPANAFAHFDACYSELPGELAPKLALAVTADLGGDAETALRYYRLVWLVDRSFTTAGFAIARLELAGSPVRPSAPPAAIAALAQVPLASIHHTMAEIMAIRTRVAMPDFTVTATPEELASLADRVQALGLDGEAYESLVCLVLLSALDWTRGGAFGPGQVPARTGSAAQVFGARLAERDVRRELERSYRSRARMAGSRGERIALVDRANSVRPRTLL